MSDVAERVRKAIPGLTNLETGYSLGFAVDYYKREEGFHVLAALSQLLGELDRTKTELRDTWVRQIYDLTGASIWIAEAEAKGLSVDEQLQRLAQLRDGAFA